MIQTSVFSRKSFLLGSLSFATVLMVGNWSGAIAQNVQKSPRYLSDQEIQVLKAESLARFTGGGRHLQDRRPSSEISKINNFMNAWQKADSSISPFLGNWGGYEESLAIYPSQTKGQVCTILTFYDGNRTQNIFNVGNVLGNKLLTDGELGKRVIVKERGTLSSGKTIDFIAIFGILNGRQGVGEFWSQRQLQEISDSRLSKVGCTASLPSSMLVSQTSIAKHPAEVVATDFYEWYLNNRASHRDLIYQKKNSFTPNLYRYLERAIRISNLPVQRRSITLNYDLFSFAQVSSYSFKVDSINFKNEVAEVYATLRTNLRPPGLPNPLKIVVAKNGNSWQIANIFYLKYPEKNYNLLSELVKFNEMSEFRNISWENNDISRLSAPPSSTPIQSTDRIAKYPTSEDFNAFEDKLQGNPESLVTLRGNQAEQRRKFQNEWKTRNPNAAKFLGAWYTGDRYFYVFPSTAKGGTCVITQDANGNLDMKIGVVLNQELRYGGGKGFFWRDRANIIASRDSGSGLID